MIVCKSVTKRFGSFTALNGVSITFRKNEIHGLIGRNGSGKTLLLKCICGLISLSSGEIRIDGVKIQRDRALPLNIGAIIEQPGFLPHYSGYENLKKLASIKGITPKQSILDAMNQVGLDSASRKWVSKYSAGMRQRLGIAQAIMEDQSLLLLDEPMNGLDNAGVHAMRALIKQLNESGKTIILTSHNPQDIECLCNTVCEMEAGNLSFISGIV